MHELKFRIWDKKEKKMIIPNILTDWCITINGNVFHEGKEWRDQSRFVIMQFSRCSLPVGGDVYQDDLLKMGNSVYWVTASKDSLNCYGLSKDGDRYGAYTLGLQFKSGYDEKESKKIRIIGNIWKTPELYKERSDNF